MSFFSEGGELRELFFESASELLQSLNDGALALEKDPANAEIVRNLRRTMHTLKGDSAACGYSELSELAHVLEDALTPEAVADSPQNLADLVLEAADLFGEMLSAYRNRLDPPSGHILREHISQRLNKPETVAPVPCLLQGRFHWTEYENACAEQALSDGYAIFNVALAVDPDCALAAAAIQMARNALQQSGTLIALHPDVPPAGGALDVIEALLASKDSVEVLERRLHIPAIVSEVLIQPHAAATSDALDDPLASLAAAIEAVSAEAVRHVDEHVIPDILACDTAVEPIQPPSTPADTPSRNGGDEAQSNGRRKSATSSAENLLRVDAERIDTVLNLVGELIIGKSMLLQGVGEMGKRFARDPLHMRLADAMAYQTRVLSDLQKSVMKIRMVPVEQLFRRYPRIVRDTAKVCGKVVKLSTTGEETDLDKSILDTLHEPLAHLVRNAIDHGIETPEERVPKGKHPEGTLSLNAYHQGNQFVLEVCDDGRGIDREKVVKGAVQRGLITAEESVHLSDSDAYRLVFHPGLSTSEQVTPVSGRGVGMDIVQSVVERLKGTVHIDSRPGAGCIFTLRVPLTLAIIKALMFRVGGKLYAIPLNAVQEITRANESSVHRVDQHEVVQLRESVLTLVRLNRMENLPQQNRKRFFVIVVNLQDRRFGLAVDQLVGEEELVIKPLEDSLVATDLVSGASILGDGTVVLILNTAAIVARLGKLRAQAVYA